MFDSEIRQDLKDLKKGIVLGDLWVITFSVKFY